jgi:FKBP-type peptidyl-prolyl cis-trans isomerase
LSGLCAWTEALQLVKVGDKSLLVCPADLAYSNQRWPPLIKPAATLVIDIEEWVCPVYRELPAKASRHPGGRASIPTRADIPGRVRRIAMEAGHGGSQAA